MKFGKNDPLIGNSSEDQLFMRKALNESRKAAVKEEIPVGAVIVSGIQVLSRAHNRSVSKCDPTAHAEILALRKACAKMKNYRLPGAVMYVTMEPCSMCLGAMVHARIERLVFGAHDPKAGAVESAGKFPWEKLNHRILIRSGVLSEECGQVLKDFFTDKRRKR